MYGGEAASLLASAVDGSPHPRRDVVRRFFDTQAGADAAYQVAATEMDNGHLLTAARLLDRLRTRHHAASRYEPELSLRCILCYWRSGETSRAAEVMQSAASAQQGLRIAGEPVPELTSPQAAMAWLTERLGAPTLGTRVAGSDWPVPHGSPTRNATAASVSPLYDDAWSVPLIGSRDADDPVQVEELRSLLEGLTTQMQDAGWPTIPAMTPLVVGELVVFPSYGLVKAVDIHDGTFALGGTAGRSYVRRWAVRFERTPVIGSCRPRWAIFSFSGPGGTTTSSQISSDGERVYCVRDSGMVGGLPPQFAERAQLNHPRRPRAYNALRAYDANGGNWKWEVGGARTRNGLAVGGDVLSRCSAGR